VDAIYDHLIDLADDGSFRLDLSYFNYCQGLTMTSRKMDRLFGGPPRPPESPIGQREMDLAASIQKVTEEIMLRCARTAHQVTGSRNLVMAGGVALNCVANGRVIRETPMKELWVQPAAGDAGGAVGVAHYLYNTLEKRARTPAWTNAYLGPEFSDAEIAKYLDGAGARYETLGEHELLERTARLLSEQNVVGWFQGRMEFGPRALGARSILADPRDASMRDTLNMKIKFREGFRPFAPSVLVDKAEEWFDIDCESP
jgi:carbamoyltransferase